MDVPSYAELENQLLQMGVKEDDLEKELRKKVEEVVAKEARLQMKHLLENFPEYRDSRARAEAYGAFFVVEKWENSLSGLMEVTDVAAQYCEDHMNDILQSSKEVEIDSLTTVLIHMLPRAVLITREITHLLRGGYPDGAMARWRTLHEMTVSAFYMFFQDDTAADKYLASMKFSERARMQELIETNQDVTFPEGTRKSLKVLKAECAEIRSKLGLKSDSDGLWPRIAGFGSIKQMEQAIGFSGARSHYAIASEHIHANIVPKGKMLGHVEGEETGFLTGSSPEGFDKPCILAATCLADLAEMFLTVRKSVSSEVMMAVIGVLLEALYDALEKDSKNQIRLERLHEAFPDFEKDFKMLPKSD